MPNLNALGQHHGDIPDIMQEIMATPPADGGEEFKWLANLDSESVIRKMKQLGTSNPASAASNKRAPRKRTKTAKAAAAEAAAAEEADTSHEPPTKKQQPAGAVQAPLFENSAPPAPEANAASSGAIPSLFKPVDVAGAQPDVADAKSMPAPQAEGPEQSVTPTEAPLVEHADVPAWNIVAEAPTLPSVQADDAPVPAAPGPNDGEATEDEGDKQNLAAAAALGNNPAAVVPQVPVAGVPQQAPNVHQGQPNAAVPTAERILSQHMQQSLAAAVANGSGPMITSAPPAMPIPAAMNTPSPELLTQLQVEIPNSEGESHTKYTGVRKNKGGRYSARIKLGGANKYLGSFPTAEEAARAFDAMAIQNGRPVETLNFPAAYGGPTVGQAYRKRKVHKLYPDPSHQINVLLQKLADVDRSNPGILRLTMGTLGVPETRYLPDNKYSGVRQQSSHWETRIRYKDKLYSMGFYASVEAAALAWDITAASLQRCRKLNFPEVSFADLEQQLDALKCVISQHVPSSHTMQMQLPLPVQMEAAMPQPPSAPNVVAPQDHVAMPQPGQMAEASMMLMPAPVDGQPGGAMSMLPPQPDTVPMMPHGPDGTPVPDGSNMPPPPAPVMDQIPTADMQTTTELPSEAVPAAEDIPHAEVPGVHMSGVDGHVQVPAAEIPGMKVTPEMGAAPGHEMQQNDDVNAGPMAPGQCDADNSVTAAGATFPGDAHAD